MTIKNFACLCGCTPKTLRYYDQIDLLRPARVDSFSGYRHYAEEQALVFVKIKNLQTAGFSIEEIRGLLGSDNEVVYAAFERKIKEQEDRLQKIREIQKSYQSEMTEMDIKIIKIREHVENAFSEYDPSEEFGIDAEEYGGVRKAVSGFFDGFVSGSVGGDLEFHDDDDDEYSEEEEYLHLMDDPAYEIVYEDHGWAHVKEIIAELRESFYGGDTAMFVKTAHPGAGLAYAATLHGMMIKDREFVDTHININITRSEDGLNHIWLLRRK